MNGGSLDVIVQESHDKYSIEFCQYTAYMAALGIKVLHEKNIIHRDIKSDNILCNTDGDIRITDLGASVLLHKAQSHRSTRAIGTNNWMAPEIVKGLAYEKEVDIWSFGAFLYELATG